MNDPDFVEPARKEKKGKYRREKAWDDDTIDHWKIEPFTPEDNKGGPFAEQSSFATLFPQYREQYLRQVYRFTLFFDFSESPLSLIDLGSSYSSA